MEIEDVTHHEISQDLNRNQRVTNRSRRPVSFYDNIQINEEDESSNLGANNNGKQPTQVHLINTTVPQNIGSKIIGTRHEPTRNSLRHSRMIVMNRSGNVTKYHTLPIVKHPKLSKGLVGLQLLLGITLMTIALWLILWTPNIRTRDNPFWSGLPLMFSGILGIILLCCCKNYYPLIPKRYSIYFIKISSIFFSLVAGTACLIASTFAMIHLISLSTMICEPLNELNATCYCQVESSNTTLLPIKSYHYLDLNCPEVNNILSILIIFSCSTNTIGSVVSLWYIYLHWVSRNYNTYSKVQTKESIPIVI